MIIGGSASQKLAANIAKKLNDKLCPIETKKFPDGERYIRVKGEIDEEIVVVQSTGNPQDENLIELLFLIKNLKSLGAKKIKVVIPYFGYGRQEKRFKSGEAISAQIVAELIQNAGATEILTINLHENSVRDFFSIKTQNISAMPAIAEHIKENTYNPIIIGPDKGALEFAEEIANILDCESTYLSKVRISPDKVETKVVNMRCDFSNDDPAFKDVKSKNVEISAVKGKEAIIIDDIIATGGTIVNAVHILKENGAKSVDVCCAHPVLVNDAVLKIYAAGARSISGTDSLKSEVSTISLAKTIAKHLK
ncbi:ribose-phosphate diphosphokinase [Methanobrevibacter filiformis]|uniref:Ribose-phosphate pyrophosphokinase n=1 Tax=Methanobrevibacter filiformis TaxID=55758 RepID=A0A165Z1D6_9EURY|nr:ribose-phosphate diphosphokinase [Methanobrevibacter filiformis]KZX10124.1 ribose-phosphate pyrophosphokinase [Methanobrevibacter filiformis]